jgi:hypothetical protein
MLAISVATVLKSCCIAVKVLAMHCLNGIEMSEGIKTEIKGEISAVKTKINN